MALFPEGAGGSIGEAAISETFVGALRSSREFVGIDYRWRKLVTLSV